MTSKKTSTSTKTPTSTKPAAAKSARTRPGATGADDTTTEFDGFICNLVPSTKTETDWGLVAALGRGALTAAAPPKSVDLRASWWDVGNQESTGSCVGWAAADGVGRYSLVNAGKIASTVRLSPRFTWMASKESDEFATPPTTFVEQAGTSLKAAVDTARRYGFALESELPFHIDTVMVADRQDAFYASCAQRKIASYFNLRRNLAEWKIWLASKGPLLVGLSVDRNFDNAKANGGKIDTFDPGSVRGGHAVSIVGYRADGRFIVRNSWGVSGWGDKGFGYVSPKYIAAAFFDEAYGVTVS